MSYRLTFLTVLPAPYQQELFAALAASNAFEICVFYYTANTPDRYWSDRSLNEFERVLPGWTFSWLGPSAHLNPRVIDILRQDNSDLVIVSDYSAPTAQLAMRYLNRTARPWVFWGEIPGFKTRGTLGRRMRRELQRPILLGAAAVAAIGTQAVQAYEKLTSGRIPVVNVPYACDLSPFRAAVARRQHRERRAVNVLFSGQLIYRKGVDVLIRAFTSIADRAPGIRLVLLGDGPERLPLTALVPPHLTQQVEFRGFVQPADLPSEFAKADIFVMPSRHDGWGIVVNEALGAGLPIIASDGVGAAHDLVKPGINGLIVPADSIDALADALLRLVKDDHLRSSLGQASLTLSSDWDLSRAVDRWFSLCAVLLPSGQ